MYEKLTKVIKIDGRECVTCALYGTDKCRIHSCGESHTPDCAHCEMFGAILNQLNAFEELVADTLTTESIVERNSQCKM